MDLCCMSSDDRERRRIHLEIERQLRRDKKRSTRELKVLLLGTSQSGKSTFIKQMRILHGSGYSEADRRMYISLVHLNIIMAIRALIDAMDDLQIDYMNEQNFLHAETLSRVDMVKWTALEPWQVHAIRRVWNDLGIQTCYDRKKKSPLPDSAKYFLSDLDRITSAFYLPTLQDILRVTVHTSGIIEYTFDMNVVLFRMVDMGGMRRLRRQWIHCFQKVSTIIYLVAISEYDEVLCECPDANRLEESEQLFKTICRCQWFQETSIILFLNKTDLLEEKITKIHLADYFPAFPGPQSDAEAAKKFILKMFEDQHVGHPKDLYAHYTCATDTENIRVVLKDVKQAILKENFVKFNLV